MQFDIMLLGMRNLLLLSIMLMMVLAAPLRAPQEILRFWRMLNKPLFEKKPEPRIKKGKSFWEIDMTDFEP